MALEASDRLLDIIWVNWRCTSGCISRPTFKLSASLLDIMGKSKDISQDLRKTIVDHKSGSSLGAISKHLKVPRSSVQTIVRNYKHHGTTQPSYRSGRRRVLSILRRICGQSWKSVCEQGGLQSWLSYTSSVRRNGPKFTQLIVGRLWKRLTQVQKFKGNAIEY